MVGLTAVGAFIAATAAWLIVSIAAWMVRKRCGSAAVQRANRAVGMEAWERKQNAKDDIGCRGASPVREHDDLHAAVFLRSEGLVKVWSVSEIGRPMGDDNRRIDLTILGGLFLAFPAIIALTPAPMLESDA